MRAKHLNSKKSAEQVVKDIRRATRKQYAAEEKIRIVPDALRGEDSIAELCRREGIAQSMYYTWSKEFMEAGKRWKKINYIKCLSAFFNCEKRRSTPGSFPLNGARRL